MITEKQARILVCGAESERRHEIAELIGRIGFAIVDEARNMSEAKELILERPYTLTICDVSTGGAEAMQLAYLDGARRTAGEKTQGAPILFIGEGSYEDVLCEVCKTTRNSYIIRPYSVAEFCDGVFGLISGRRSGKLSLNLPEVYAGFIGGDDKSKKSEDDSSSLEGEITTVLHSLGIPAHIKGFAYLRSAIGMTAANPDMINYVTKTLYPGVAKVYSTTTSRVERAIRHAIEVAWDRGDVDTLNRYFGYTISRQRGKPTNSEFIAMISEKLRLGVGI